MEVVVIWLGLSVLAGVIAARKGRSGIGFFLLAALLSPLIGIIAALIANSDAAVMERRRLESGQERKCPHCAELVRIDARVCKHCGRDL